MFERFERKSHSLYVVLFCTLCFFPFPDAASGFVRREFSFGKACFIHLLHMFSTVIPLFSTPLSTKLSTSSDVFLQIPSPQKGITCVFLSKFLAFEFLLGLLILQGYAQSHSGFPQLSTDFSTGFRHFLLYTKKLSTGSRLSPPSFLSTAAKHRGLLMWAALRYFHRTKKKHVPAKDTCLKTR